MKSLRIGLHWELQTLADWLWDRRWLHLGNAACRLAGRIYPAACKADPAQWNGHWR